MPFIDDGYEIIDDFVEFKYLQAIKSEITSSKLKISGGGIRNAEKKLSSIESLITLPELSQKAERYLGDTAHLVRVILFDKTAVNNWSVPWHQDKTIRVSKRQDIVGWGPWCKLIFKYL